MKYFRVKIGYKADEFLAIDETELATALNAQITGRVGVFKTGSVRGNDIISIKPDFNKMLGYNPSYVMTEHDYVEIPKKLVSEHNLALENAGEIVKAKMENRAPQLKEASVQIHTQGMTSLANLLPK